MWLANLLHVNDWTLAGAAWGIGLSLVMFVGSLAVVVALLVKIPPTYFLQSYRERRQTWRHPILHWAGLIAKNIAGVALVVIGIVMLAAPGQGLLTLLVGLMLLDIPGKRRLERKVVKRKRVLASINWLRSKFDKPPLVVD